MAAISKGNIIEQALVFPEVVLDTTLAELLAEDPGGKRIESLCNIKPCADPRHKTLPINKKYLITSARASDDDDLAHLQLENVSYLLSFWAGRTDVYLIACEGWDDINTVTKESVDANAKKAFSALNESQRPRPITFSTKDDLIQHKSNTRTPIRWGFAVDFAEHMPCFVHPQEHYRLNTKRWLAECSLKGANDRIIDPQGFCSKHRTKDGLWYFKSSCDECKASVEKDVNLLKEKLQQTEPPFVLKITQSLGSVGTMLVTSKEDRDKAIADIAKIQTEALPYITAENAYIYPASLVLSDFLPGDTHALNFYVRSDGSIRFISSCHQLSTRVQEGGRQHTALTWDEQEKLEARFKDKLSEIGQVLRNEGYFGPCGADIMETDDGTQYVIDLNVRTTTSTVLGCLRTHCQKRNFNACGVYECLLLSLSRERLEQEFQKEFEEGRIILLGQTRLGKKSMWAYPVVLAGEDQDALKDLGARILQFEATGGGDAQDAGGA